MAIQTKLQPKYWIRMLVIGVVCVILGLWGVYDYLVKIPAQQEAFERGEVCRKMLTALEAKLAYDADPSMGAPAAQIQDAAAVVQALDVKLAEQVKSGLTKEEIENLTAERAAELIKENELEGWVTLLSVFKLALFEAEKRAPDQEPTPIFLGAFESAKTGADRFGEYTEPSQFDRIVQWMFILCLPFAPWCVWVVVKARKQVYRLDDDGTLHAPGVVWPAGEIKDINMGRWMSKSQATVIHEDGSEVMIDDYLYRDGHLIVGAIASEKYPEEWTEEAKPVPVDEEDDEDEFEGEWEEGDPDAEPDDEPEEPADDDDEDETDRDS